MRERKYSNSFLGKLQEYCQSSVSSACCLTGIEGIHARCSCDIEDYNSTSLNDTETNEKSTTVIANPTKSRAELDADCKIMCTNDEKCKGYVLRNYTDSTPFVRCELATDSNCSSLNCTGLHGNATGPLDPYSVCAQGGRRQWGDGCTIKCQGMYDKHVMFLSFYAKLCFSTKITKMA